MGTGTHALANPIKVQIRNEITNCETTGLGNRLLRQKTRPFTSPVHFPPIADPKFSEVKWSTQILLFSSSWSTVWNEIFHRIASRFNCLQAPPTTTTTPSHSPTHRHPLPHPPSPSQFLPRLYLFRYGSYGLHSAKHCAFSDED